VRGSSRVLSKIQELTEIKTGETNLDLKFSLKAVTCMGCCSAGSLVTVDGKIHSNMDPAKIEEVFNNFD
jgi:NADH-quinone oxidoreductase subunit E